MTKHAIEWKKGECEEIRQLVKKYPVVAVADLSSFPAPLFQQLRKQLAGKAVFRVSKMRVIKKALADAGLSNLADATKESCALVLTEMNPFELYATLKKNKGRAAVKAGMVAPMDITIPAGDTGLPPGPALSDLKAAGLSVRIQGGTIVIAEDKVATKAGEIVQPAVAATLAKLDIKPLKIGLNLIAALEKGQLYMAGVLDIDTEKVFWDFCSAHAKALALALEIAYPAPETMPALISRAASQARALALEAGICTEETMPALLARAEAAAAAIKAMAGDAAGKAGDDAAGKAGDDAAGKGETKSREGAQAQLH